jgi:uncharacterized protein YggE
MPATTVTIPLPGSRVGWLAVGLAAGLLAALVARPALGPALEPVFTPPGSLAADATTPPEHKISVSGTGKVVISPDIADLRLGVSATKPTVKDARAAAAASMTAVIAALRSLEIPDADLKTTQLSLQPVYVYTSGNPPRLTGYTVSNAIVATIRDLDKVAPAVDGAMAAGATTMNGITFRVADPARAEVQARQAAMAQAKAKADTLAASAGVAIGGVASISETSSGTPYLSTYAGEKAAAPSDVATPIEPGSNEVTVTVSVVYLIR